MFENLERLLNEKNITKKAYAEFLGISGKALYNKLNGITEFTYSEVEKTSKFLFPEYNLEYVFNKKEESAC